MSVQVPLVGGAPLVPATFVARRVQLVVEVRLGERQVLAHMADRGRLETLLVPGARLLLAPRQTPGRKTGFQVAAVYTGDELVSLDTQLANRLIAAALAVGALPQFARYSRVQPEARVGAHHFDFRLSEGLATCLLEVKSVGQVINGVALFPDAPTERGQQHVQVLTTLAQHGQRTAMIFVVQRSSGWAFAPNEEIDPVFAQALRRAINAGVEVYAYRCPVTPEGIRLGEPLPVYHDMRHA